MGQASRRVEQKTMRRIRLHNQRAAGSLALSQTELAGLRRLALAGAIEPSASGPGLYELTPGSQVGVVRRGDDAESSARNWVSTGYSSSCPTRSTRSPGRTTKWIWLRKIRCWRSCAHLLPARGPRNVPRAPSRLSHPRGGPPPGTRPIRFQEQISRRYGQLLPVELRLTSSPRTSKRTALSWRLSIGSAAPSRLCRGPTWAARGHSRVQRRLAP